ncbi:ABC transporter gloK [Fusarium oxysporum f. sp. albedinis]|nr:ABC transporter gloK [Fusarium oxysporum f. sp. albedinis]
MREKRGTKRGVGVVWGSATFNVEAGRCEPLCSFGSLRVSLQLPPRRLNNSGVRVSCPSITMPVPNTAVGSTPSTADDSGERSCRRRHCHSCFFSPTAPPADSAHDSAY